MTDLPMTVAERLADIPKRPQGPVEILCKEIGYPFDKRLEKPDVLVAFVRVLVSHVAQMRALQEQIKDVTGKAPSAGSAEVLARTLDMLAANDPETLIPKAAAVHELSDELNPDEAYPTDHLIDMLSSCASAIRFGLEVPCHSRHAAEAANHVWKRLYGVSLFDSFTPAWEKDWACAQFRAAVALRYAELSA